ncbi:hypothetical protein GOB94_12120 [Granulicella sp. 5B5]|uniref:hypothetical protein n=1 Tax=Granulicella sp. 5B5 TaxID=1617967 RepID=UPI0015F68ABE|nr:hypothetical protein [Granulicella sp. 5B5]QMV19344.1 hypothetical protein GOB94_12120 [Granulicella sp. 5B5]
MKDTSFARTFPPDRLQAAEAAAALAAPRRTTHGSCAWSLPSRGQALRQPQDGAANASSLRSIDGRPLANPLVEADDARLNGSLRSLARRVKGLNVMQSRPADALLQTEFYFSEKPVASLTPLPSDRTEAAPPRKTPDTARPRNAKPALQPQVA